MPARLRLQREGQINLANLSVTDPHSRLWLKGAVKILPSAIGLARYCGAKLKTSSQLDLKALDDSFVYWRRWALVMSLWGLGLG